MVNNNKKVDVCLCLTVVSPPLLLFSSNVGENDHTLSLDVINEDPARPGHIGSAQLPLASVFDSGRFEDWLPLSTSSGSPLGFIYIKLNFTVSYNIKKKDCQY
jgi:hypothetical protein